MSNPIVEPDRSESAQVQDLDDLVQRDRFFDRDRVERLLVAAAITLFFHALLFLVLRDSLLQGGPLLQEKKPTYHIKLTPLEEPPPLPDHYVEANPEVPQNKPDDTVNFSSRDQQAAQPEKPEEIGPSPALDGEDPDSNKIVSGEFPDPSQQEPLITGGSSIGAQPVPPTPADLANQTLTPPALPDALKAEGLNEGEGIAAYTEVGEAEKLPEEDPDPTAPVTMNPLSMMMQQAQRDPTSEGAQQIGPQAPQPRPRPRVRIETQPGPLRKSNTGVTNESGAVSWDAEFSEFGDYLQRMFEAIGLRWNELNRYGQAGLSEVRSYVQIQFYITREGQVQDLEIVRSTAGEAAKWRCIDAIQSNAPYFPWTTDMAEILGERQPVRVTFHYR